MSFTDIGLPSLFQHHRLSDDDSRPAQAKAPAAAKQNPFRNQDPYTVTTNYAATGAVMMSAPSSPRSRSSGHVTPPPNSRHKRTSTPPGASSISRTNSRHSKSSSEGSWDTPAPSSPPHGSVGGMKPPHARSTPVSKTRRKSAKEEKTVAVDTLSEAFYSHPWMCGFADAFNFDGFDKFQK